MIAVLRYITTFDEAHNPSYEHQLMTIVDPNSGEHAFEERATREVTRPTDMAGFLCGDRDVLTEYTSAIHSVGPFSVACLATQEGTTDQYEPHFYAVASDRFPYAPELYLDDYKSYNHAVVFGLPWYLPATLVHAPHREAMPVS